MPVTAVREVLEPPPWVGVPERPPLRERTVVALVVVVGLVVAWLWVGLHPAVTSQGVLEVRGVQRTSTAFTETAWVVGPTGGRLVLEVRNDGRLPVVLSASDEASTDVARLEGFLRPRSDGLADLERATDEVSVGPGERAQVVLLAGVLPPYCRALPPGLTGTSSEVVLTARTLGLPATQRLPLPHHVQVVAPSRACR